MTGSGWLRLRRREIQLAGAFGALLFAVGVAAGPMIGVGLVFGTALAAAVFRQPIIGLGLMVLAGTALQVLSSEHLTGLPLSLGKLVGMLTLLAWLTRILQHRLPLTYSPQLPALVAFGAALCVSVAIANDKHLAMDGLFRYAQLFLLFLMIASIAGESERLIDYACIAVTASMSLSAIIGLLEFLLPTLAIESDDPSLASGAIGAIVDRDSLDGVEIKRITGGQADSNWFAYTLVSFLPVNLYLFHRYRGQLARGLILSAVALQCLGIVLSYTRSAIIALGVSAFVLVLRGRISPKLVAIIGALGAALFAIWNPAGLVRIFSPEVLKEGSTPLRQYMLYGGIHLIMQNPIFGYGYMGYGAAFFQWLQTQSVGESLYGWERAMVMRFKAGEEQVEYIMPHNTIVQIWVEYGVIGFSAFTGFFLAIVRDLRVSSRFGSPQNKLLSDCILAGLVGFLVCTLFGNLAMLKVIWILGGISAALRRVALSGELVTTPAGIRAEDDASPKAAR